MKRFFYFAIIILGLSALIGTGTSCKKEMFDPAMYDTLITIQSPVDSVDPSHTWELSTSKYLIITANAGTGTRQVQILSDNPLTSNDAQIINQLDMAEGDRVGLSVSYPSHLTTLYAAAIDSTGAYTVVQFNPSNRDVDFSNPISKAQQVSSKPAPQYYAFCYEQEFPEPGDYDYNDVVMHIALERSFNKEITDQYMMVQKSRDLLLKGRNGEPILNLFADAHWATGDILNADFGMFQRKMYNVTKQSSSDAQQMVPREVTFVLRFKTDIRANSMTLDNIDPFIMRQYNGANMEIHTFPYRSVMALNEYHYIDVGNLPWALKVPQGSFFHPLHGVNMGFRMRDSGGTGIMFGAYATSGHAFGEWAMSKNKATDWYFYPDNSNVFVW